MIYVRCDRQSLAVCEGSSFSYAVSESVFANSSVCCQNGALLWLDEANRAVCCSSDAKVLMPMSDLDVTVSGY